MFQIFLKTALTTLIPLVVLEIPNLVKQGWNSVKELWDDEPIKDETIEEFQKRISKGE